MEGKIRYSRDIKEIIVDAVQGGTYPVYNKKNSISSQGIHIGNGGGRDFFVVLGKDGAELCETDECIIKLDPSNLEVIPVNPSRIPLNGQKRILAEEVLSKIK